MSNLTSSAAADLASSFTSTDAATDASYLNGHPKDRTSKEDLEAYQELCSLARKRTGQIPVSVVARHVLDITPAHDWPVQRAAMAAVLRRIQSSRADKLLVSTRPKNKKIFGRYRTLGVEKGVRPYEVILAGLDPFVVRCGCPDFVRNSLKICKHSAAVLSEIYGDEEALKKALAESSENSQLKCGYFEWDPVRAYEGAGDGLAQVRFCHPNANSNSAPLLVKRVLNRYFVKDGAVSRIDLSKAQDSRSRLTLLKDLERAVNYSQEGNPDNQLPPYLQDPALKRFITEELEILAGVSELPVDAKKILAALNSTKRPLYSYQQEGVLKFLERGRLLLADDMGLGKTAQAIGAAHCLAKLGVVNRGLLIVPSPLKPQWEREWQTFSDVSIEIVDGTPDQRADLYKTRPTRVRQPRFLIANYEQILRDIELISQWGPQFIILDEAQRIKNWETKTAQYIKLLSPKYRLVLTGTPIENRIDELASIMDWVNSFALEPKWRLRPLHTIYIDGESEVGGARNLDTLRCRVYQNTVRRIRKEVLSQLPPRTDTCVPTTMTATQIDEHDALIQPIIRLTQIAKKRPLTRAQFLSLMQLFTTQRILCNGMELFEFEDRWPELQKIELPSMAILQGLLSPKLVELRQLIESLVLDQDRKVVVFSQWTRMLKLAAWAVAQPLKAVKARCAFFTGEESQKRRTQNVIDFHDDPSCRVLFLSDAGGVGLNLQRASSACINLELPWNPAVLEQRIGRIYRLGQSEPIDVYNLVSAYGIETRIQRAIQNKQATFAGLFDGDSNEVTFAESQGMMEFLEKLVDPVELPKLPAMQSDVVAEDAVNEFESVSDIEGSADIARLEHSPSAAEAAQGSNDVQVPVADIGAAGESSVEPGSNDLTKDRSWVIPLSGESGNKEHPVTQLFSQVKFSSNAKGEMVLTASPEAAKTLSVLFGGLAKLLGNS